MNWGQVNVSIIHAKFRLKAGKAAESQCVWQNRKNPEEYRIGGSNLRKNHSINNHEAENAGNLHLPAHILHHAQAPAFCFSA